MRETDVQIRPLKRTEYECLVEQGFFEPGERIELIDGLLLVAEPQSSYHYTGMQLVEQALARALGEGWVIRGQGPVALDDTSEPEPDVAIVRGTSRDYAHAHPAEPVLVVEVALSSLVFDRTIKSSLYARAGRPEYWIVNLVDDQIEVYTEPSGPADAPGFGSRTDFKRGDVVPVTLDGAKIGTISVEDVLP